VQTRQLGKSGLQVSVIGLGLWAIGGSEWGRTHDHESLSSIDAALEAGVSLFDTADVYGGGHSEELLGRAMRRRRGRFIVATKIGWLNFDHQRRTSAYDTAAKIVAGVESNLKRLGTDYIDVIQRHVDFPDPTVDSFIEGFQALQVAGKVRAYGLSTSDFDFLREFNADGRCATLQIDYSLLNRTPEAEILPYCEENNIAVIVRGPLAMGILTGKFDRNSTFGENDFRRRWHESEEEHAVFLRDLAKVERLRRLTDHRSLTELAIKFSISHQAVTASIPGAKTVAQVKENMAAASLPAFTAAEIATIDDITPREGGRKIWPA